MPLLQAFEATDDNIFVKFDSTVLISSLTLDRFNLYIQGATPTPVVNPFQPIRLIDDYDTISRRLTLKFEAPVEGGPALLPNTTYLFTITGLQDASQQTLSSSSNTFTTGATVLPELPVTPPEPLVIVEDKSIRSRAFIQSDVLFVKPSSDFYIVETDPAPDELMVENARNSGRVTIAFSGRPAAHFLTSKHFKAQRKKVQRAPSRWENIAALISLDADDPFVYLDFPSNDATPVYGVPGLTYFVDGYHYRVRISKDVGLA